VRFLTHPPAVQIAVEKLPAVEVPGQKRLTMLGAMQHQALTVAGCVPMAAGESLWFRQIVASLEIGIWGTGRLGPIENFRQALADRMFVTTTKAGPNLSARIATDLEATTTADF
jgi:hypothetical protein